MKKHLLAIALFALCTTGLNAASPKKVTPENHFLPETDGNKTTASRRLYTTL